MASARSIISVEIFDGLGPLDLGDHIDGLPFCLGKPFHFQNVFRCFSKRNTEGIHPLLQGKCDKIEVRIRYGFGNYLCPGDAQSLVGKKRTADNRPAEDILTGHLFHQELYEAVIEENQVSIGHTLRQSFVLDRDLGWGAHEVFDGQNDLIPLFQQKWLLQEFPDSYLGAGKIGHDQAMTLKSFRNGLDALNILPVALQGPMGEIEPRHIHALQHQPFQ